MKNLHFLGSSYRNKIIYTHKQLILFLEHEKVKTLNCNAVYIREFCILGYQIPLVRALHSIPGSYRIQNLWVFCDSSVQNNPMHNSALRGAELTHAAFLCPLIVFICNWRNKKSSMNLPFIRISSTGLWVKGGKALICHSKRKFPGTALFITQVFRNAGN